METSPLSEYDEKVLKSLSDPRFDFRTVEGLSSELGLDEGLVRSVLAHHKDVVRVSSATDKRGRTLYALRQRPITAKERLATLREAAGLSRSG